MSSDIEEDRIFDEERAERRLSYGCHDTEPACYIDKDLFGSCAKYFGPPGKPLWVQLEEGWHVERYDGVHLSEGGILLCYNAYARYLLRGFKDDPRWDKYDEAVCETPESEARVARCYKIWGFQEGCENIWQGRYSPIEGHMKGMKLRSGKHAQLAMPIYPRIEEHKL